MTQTVVREFEAELEVLAVEAVADGVVALDLGLPGGGELPGWTPGAHIDLVLGDGIVRQYSLCGRTQETESWRVAVLRTPEGRGGSLAVHALVKGDRLTIRGPRNHFPVVSASRYLFIAGGIGITPILTMIDEVEAMGAEWELFYGGRSRSSMAFAEHLSTYGDAVHLVPEDTDGMLDLSTILAHPRSDTAIYACGPEGMLGAVETGCAEWPAGSLHLERFAAKDVGPLGEDTAFELVLQRSGRSLDVPADRSVFDVVREAGVSVLGSCLEGICGTCETEVVDGEVDHRDSVLDDEERASNEVMMICVSRCHSSTLTLDL